MVYVFGSTGMLGGYVVKYFKAKGYDVWPIGRDMVDVMDTHHLVFRGLIRKRTHGDVVINCIGLIKQKITDLDTIRAIRINSVFPWVLNEICAIEEIPMVHISTDCCFSGKRGLYTEDDRPDPLDIYGQTKAAGEPLCTVIRTSIIGEAKDDKSLLEWVRSKDGETISGYTNHNWNGVTCWQLAKAMEFVVRNGLYWRGVRHYFGETVTKAQLVRCIADEYCESLMINEVPSLEGVDRTLSTVYPNTFLNLITPPIREQIKQQHELSL